MEIFIITYILICTKVWSNTLSIFVNLATMIYISEKMMSQKNLVKTYNERLVVALIFFTLMTSVANLCVPVSVDSCSLKRLLRPFLLTNFFRGQHYHLLYHLPAIHDGDHRAGQL